jgi:signal transduction histidine kinase
VLCTYAWLRPARSSLPVLGVAILLAAGPAALRDRWNLAGVWLAASLLAWSWGALGRAAEARRAAERQRAVLEERARIGRELHDVLSHTVAVMVVQTAAADDVFDIDPSRARQAVRSAEQAGREALAELRWFLRTVDESAEGGPQPSLADLPRLIARTNEAGLTVDLRTEGDLTPVPRGVQLSAYRIIQEALTNVLRHAATSTADVLIRVSPAEVRLEIRNDGRADGSSSAAAPDPFGDGSSAAALESFGGGPAGSGRGLVGMRERAALHGGTLEAGPVPGGGFRVSARLPWKDEA